MSFLPFILAKKFNIIHHDNERKQLRGQQLVVVVVDVDFKVN